MGVTDGNGQRRNNGIHENLAQRLAATRRPDHSGRPIAARAPGDSGRQALSRPIVRAQTGFLSTVKVTGGDGGQARAPHDDRRRLPGPASCLQPA